MDRRARRGVELLGPDGQGGMGEARRCPERTGLDRQARGGTSRMGLVWRDGTGLVRSGTVRCGLAGWEW